jgi:three-Cys-motif partner protein
MKKENAKDIILPHTQAKLDLYKSYLEKYLPILTLAKGISKINLYDIFCGIGLYKDGNLGSPMISVETINKTNELVDSKGWKRKQVNLTINDGNEEKIENVKMLLNGVRISNCIITYHNLDADDMLNLVSSEIANFSNSERSLVFIDPYGYSKIDKQKILSLLNNGHTEIVLFLPTMQMYRFSEVALTDLERKCYEDLRRFILEFIPSTDNFQDIFEFINSITKAFSFSDRFYSCSHYIERGKGNYYAIFFITSNIYGLERMLEVKWKQDPSHGKGFKRKKQVGLFDELLIEYDRKRELENLRVILINELSISPKGMSNTEIYSLTLKNEFLPKHVNEVIKQLRVDNKIYTTDEFGNESNFGNATYIDYDHYKKNFIKIYFKLK